LPSTQILDCLSEIRQLPPMPTVADKLDPYERFSCLDGLIVIAIQWPAYPNVIKAGRSNPPSFWDKLFTRSIDWDPALRNVNKAYDRCQNVARMTDRSALAKAMADIDQEFGVRATNLRPIDTFLMGPKSRGNQIGKVVIGLMLPAIDKVVTSRERNDQLQRNLHLAFALAAYHADQGR